MQLKVVLHRNIEGLIFSSYLVGQEKKKEYTELIKGKKTRDISELQEII